MIVGAGVGIGRTKGPAAVMAVTEGEEGGGGGGAEAIRDC